MKGVNFCSPEHRETYLAALDAAILKRLKSKPIPTMHRKPGFPLKAPRPQAVTALVVARVPS